MGKGLFHFELLHCGEAETAGGGENDCENFCKNNALTVEYPEIA